MHGVSVSQLAIPEKATREYERALGCLGSRDVPGAVAHLKKAVELAPEFASALNHLGTISYQTQDYAEAEKYFREALAQDPDSYSPLVNLGAALFSQGKIAESLAINERAVDARPDDALAHSQLGQSYFRLGKQEEAEKHLKQAKALDPRHFSLPQFVLAQIYEQKQDYTAMIAELEELMKYHPDSQAASRVAQAIEAARAQLRKTPAP
jgi:tetratricopeptide (TPR) repeat protein